MVWKGSGSSCVSGEARSLRVWGSRSEWLTEGEGQQTVVEHIQVGKQREKGERFSFKRAQVNAC